VPEGVGFATKPMLAARMLACALDAGVPAAWVTGDEVYGANPALRAELQALGVGYVPAVARDHRVRFAGRTHRVDTLLTRVPAKAWQCVSAGEGAKGHRHYDWAFVRLDQDRPAPDGQAGTHWLLVRRNRTSGELAFHRCFTPRSTPLAVLVNVAGRRWTVEAAFQAGKGLCGLDQHQVRCWRSWYRWATLAMLAHAVLAITALAERARDLYRPGWSRSPTTRSSTCSRRCSPGPLVIATTGCAGRHGDADIKPAPAHATTADRQPGTHEDHDLWLEY
jgi:SRSO17 transposase